MKIFFASLSLICLVNLINGARILGIFPMPAHSHFSVGFRLLKELADRGHQVTMVSPYPQKTPIKNYKDVSLADTVEPFEKRKSKIFQNPE